MTRPGSGSRAEGNKIGRRVACVLLLSPRESVTAFAEACFRFSPQVAVRDNEAVFIEIGGSRALFSEESVEARLRVLAKRLLASSVRISISDTAASALVAARFPDYARTRDLKRLPLEALADYADPFASSEKDADLSRRVLRIRCILESLGVRSVGGFAVLPRESLASRLGKDALGLMAKVWGEMAHAWPGFHPTPRIVEREEVRDPEAHGLCCDLEGAMLVLRGLVDRAMARLRGRGERVSSLEVRFHPVNRHWRVDLAIPQGSTTGLLPILRDRLAHELGRIPLPSPVEAMEVEVVESVPGAGMQRDFFSRKEEEREAWDGVVARLSQKLGKDRVFVAFPSERFLPERAYARKLVSVPTIRVAEEGVQVVESGSRLEAIPDEDLVSFRPARMLKAPELLVKDGRMLRAPGGRQWKVVSWEGPERISGEWWKDPAFEGFSRDYYRVITEGGDQLWVYVCKKGGRSQGAPSFFLHGYFD